MDHWWSIVARGVDLVGDIGDLLSLDDDKVVELISPLFHLSIGEVFIQVSVVLIFI